MVGLIAFSDLISAKTLAQWKQTIINIATLQSLRVENWEEGGFMRTTLALFAQLYTTAGEVIRLLAASAFLDTAEGAWLTLLAKQVFDVDRIAATYASAALGLTLTNSGGELFIFDAGDIVVANSGGKTYRNASGGTLNPGAGQTLALDLQAEEAGSGSNAGIGTITVMVTTFPGVSCSNTLGLVGLDEENDPALRQRCRDSLGALSIGGIKKAYEFYAKSAVRTDGSPIGVTRVRVDTPPGDGTMTVYLATGSGAISGPDVGVIQDIFDTQVTPYGFNGIAASAVNYSHTAPCTIWIPSSLGLTTAEARQKVFDALQAYVQALPIGGIIITPDPGKIFWRAVLGVVESSIPGMIKAQLTSEADVTLTIDQAPVWGGVLTDTAVTQVTG